MLKYLKPAHLLPRMPAAGRKSLKAITMPYIGRYVKQIKITNAGSISRYSPALRRIRMPSRLDGFSLTITLGQPLSLKSLSLYSLCQ